MKSIFIILFSFLTFTGCGYYHSDSETDQIMKETKIAIEKAYFEGQRDAINGDIRIKLGSDSCYVWVKSPWNDGHKPVFQPTLLDSKIVN